MTPRRLGLCVSLLAGSFLLGACPSRVEPARPSAAAPADGPRFDVAVDAPSTGTAGKANSARITVSPRAPWHMNVDYPAKLRMRAPDGVEIAVPEQRSSEAERFDAGGLAFVLPFVPRNKGPRKVAGELQFAVCGDEACAPESVPVDFTIDVACDTGSVC